MIKYCPECGEILKFKGFNLGTFDPNGSCGAIVYYQCLKCSGWWRDNQLGIVSRPTNLQKVSPSMIRKEKTKEEKMPKFSVGEKVKVVKLLDDITSRELIGMVGIVEEIDKLPNGDFNYYVSGHYVHEEELVRIGRD
jgi:hypothetical protein